MPRFRLLLLASLGLLLASCALPAQRTVPPLQIGAVYPLTGPQSSGGKDELAGVQTAVSLVNADGGVQGRRVALVIKDANNAAEGIAAVDSLVRQEHVPVIVGSYSSIVSVAASAAADHLHTVWWETGAVADAVTARHLPYVFRTVAAGSSLGRMSARFTARVLLPADHLTAAQARVVLVYEHDVYGRSVAQGALAEAKARGLHVVEEVPYNAGQFDPTAVAARVAAAHADYLWDASYLPDGVAIWRAIVATGIHLKGAIGTSSAFCMPEFGHELGPLATGLYASDKADSTINPISLDPAARALLIRAGGAYLLTEHRTMSISALAGFVGAWALLHDVLPHATGVTPGAVRAAALAANLPAGSEINGAGLSFAPPTAADSGQNIRAANVVWQWQAAGQRVVYPAPYDTAKPVIQDVPLGPTVGAKTA